MGCGSTGHGTRARSPASTTSRTPAPPIRAVAFDLFTLFDPRGVDARIAELAPDAPASFAVAWRTRIFEYSWIRAASGQYADFHQLIGDAFDYGCAHAGLHVEPTARVRLIDAYQELDPWPDSRAILERLRAEGRVLSPLANFTPSMIESLLGRAGLRGHFDTILSTDAVQTYKPDPRAYQLGPDRLGFDVSEIAFAAFGGWDAAGARWFGYPTFWVNRLATTEEVLVSPDAMGPTLTAMADWLTTRER